LIEAFIHSFIFEHFKMKLWILSPNRPQNHTITGANVLIFLLETYFVDTRYIRTVVNFREDDVLHFLI